MVELRTTDADSDNLPIVKEEKIKGEIQSDAWPRTLNPKIKSSAHGILLGIIGSGKFSDKKISYKPLSEED